MTNRRSPAFTIVELLIVIVVIAVLAAITVVAFNGIQDRARASAASSALSNAIKKIKYAQAELDSVAALDCTAFSSAVGATTTSCTPEVGDTKYQYTQNLGGTYCITATVENKSYRVTGAAPTPVEAACAGHGSGGVAAVTNLATNPSLETTLAGWAGVSATATRVTTGAVSGTYALAITPGANVDSFARYGSTSTLPAGITPGATYTISGTIYTPVAQTGSIDSRARGITVYSWTGASVSKSDQSTRAPNTAGASTRISSTFTVPADANGVEMRFYNGASNTATNIVYWDAIMLTAGSTNYNFADGNTPNWVWDSTPDNSHSTGPQV